MQTRRTFIRTMTIGTTAVLVVPWPQSDALADPVQPPQLPGWSGPAGQAKYRIDGRAKVLGEKIFARDFRPADIPGWPKTWSAAYMLRAVHADRPVTGLNLDKLPTALRPQNVITQATLDQAKVFQSPWPDIPGTLFVGMNTVPYYLGQPVAILIFDDPAAGAAAWRLMQFEPSYVAYGDVTKPVDLGILSHPYYYIRYSEDGKEVFSQVQQLAAINPTSTQYKADCEGKRYRDQIAAMLASAPSRGWTTFDSTTATQTIDPMFMEPQTGMAYFQNNALGLVLGTQSPDGDAQTIGDNLSGSQLDPSSITIYSCYPGGGFGGRDTSNFTMFLTIASVFSPGKVVRLEYDRFEQFQGGLKRNGSKIEQTFAVDAEGRLQAIKSTITIVGGGKTNYSPFVAELAGICGAGSYAVRMNDITAEAVHTIGPTAGSMRGFGGPQAFFAVEHLMDRIAAAMKLDPIELRLRNVLREGEHTVTGAPITAPLALREICERARDNPLWKNREQERRRREGGTTRYGVGFALANQAYGTGNDGVLGRVELQRDGTIAITTNAVDMGNGAATSLAITTARSLGANAASIEMGNITFYDVLGLTDCPTTKPAAAPSPRFTRGLHALRARAHASASTTPQACAPNPVNPEDWSNPCYTAQVYMSSSACITAFHQTHVIEQASRAIFLTGIVPAARSLWSDATISLDAMRWENGALVAPRLAPLPLSALAAEAHRLGVTTGATAHACYQGKWIEADYVVGGTKYEKWPIDALAVKFGSGEYTRIVRQNVVRPLPQAQYYGRSLYAPSGTLAALEIDRRTGAARLLDIVTYVDAGRPIQRQLLEGQYEGAVAMGFGYTFLESMPQGVGGPGDGKWNLNRYGLALATDLPPLGRMQLVTLREDSHPKGIAEAVLCPIPPALANAAAHATGRFYDALPITMQQLREAL